MIIKVYELLKNKLTPSKKIVFIHLPKAGGTSLNSALKRKYIFSHHVIDVYMRDFTIDGKKLNIQKRWEMYYGVMLYNLKNLTSFVSGHVPVDDIFFENSEDYIRITLLRNPIDRLISLYYYNFKKKYSSLDDFLKSKEAAFHSQIITKYFSGQYFDNANNNHVEQAIKNLKKFQIVGNTNAMVSVENELSNFGINIKIEHKNKNHNRPSNIDGHIMHKIEELCKYDLKVYREFYDV